MVRVLAVGDPAVYGYTDPKLGILAAFQAEQGIEVAFDIVPWAEYGGRLFQVAAEDNPAYDVVMVAGHLWLGQFVRAGYLAPLDNFTVFQSPEYDPEDILERVREEMRYDGVHYLVPSFSDGHIVYMREGAGELIDSDGFVDVKSFDKVAQGLAKEQGHPRVAPMVMKAAPSEIFLDWLPYLRAFGADFITPRGEPLFNTIAGRESLAYYVSLKRHLSETHAPYGNEEVARALRDGEVSFGVSWGGQAGVIVDAAAVTSGAFEYAIPRDPWNVTWSFGVLSGSSNKEEAATLLSWLSNKENDKKIGRYAGSPSRRSTYADGELRKRCPWFPAQEALLDHAIPLPSRSDLADLMAPMYEALSSAFSGQQTPTAALDSAAKFIQKQV